MADGAILTSDSCTVLRRVFAGRLGIAGKTHGGLRRSVERFFGVAFAQHMSNAPRFDRGAARPR